MSVAYCYAVTGSLTLFLCHRLVAWVEAITGDRSHEWRHSQTVYGATIYACATCSTVRTTWPDGRREELLLRYERGETQGTDLRIKLERE